MRLRISVLFLAISLLLTPSALQAADTAHASVGGLGFAPTMPGVADSKPQTKNSVKESDDKAVEAPFFGGVYLSADVFGYIFPIFVSDTYYSAEVAASIDLKHRFYPTVEAGYGYCNTIGQLYGVRYATSGPYLRIGMDYNMQYKTGAPNYILAGFRVGATQSPYEVEASALVDPIFETATPFHLTDMPCTSLWAEALVGVRAQLAGGFCMGWTIRYKRMLHTVNRSEYGNPWYVPGYGVYGKETVGATYNLTWYFSVGGKTSTKKGR